MFVDLSRGGDLLGTGLGSNTGFRPAATKIDLRLCSQVDCQMFAAEDLLQPVVGKGRGTGCSVDRIRTSTRGRLRSGKSTRYCVANETQHLIVIVHDGTTFPMINRTTFCRTQ